MLVLHKGVDGGVWGGRGKKRVLAIPNLPGVFPPVSIASDK